MTPLTRRQFLATTAAACLARTALGETPVQPLVGSQLYGWTQYYQREGKNFETHLDEVLSALRDAGYDYAEHHLSRRPEENVRFAERLRSKGLKPVSLYTGGALHDADKAEATVQSLIAGARGAKEAGFTIINCNPDPLGHDKSDEQLSNQVKALQELGKRLNEIGLQLGVHNHTPEMRNGAKEFHANFQRTDAGLVGFCYDVHWVYRGGVAPADALKAYGSRIVSWHLRQSRGKIWWEDLDSGDVDYAAIAEHARTHGLPAKYTVELALEQGTQITRSVVENHARSRQYVKQVFGV